MRAQVDGSWGRRRTLVVLLCKEQQALVAADQPSVRGRCLRPEGGHRFDDVLEGCRGCSEVAQHQLHIADLGQQLHIPLPSLQHPPEPPQRHHILPCPANQKHTPPLPRLLPFNVLSHPVSLETDGSTVLPSYTWEVRCIYEDPNDDLHSYRVQTSLQ